MGSKRVGLARTQALLENLKRDLSLTNSTDIGCGRVTTSDTIFARGSGTTVPSIITKWPAHTDGTAGNATLTIAQLLTGIVEADPAADIAWTMPTPTLVVAGITGCAVGDCIDFSIINTGTAGADEIITVTAVSNGTLVGSGTVPVATDTHDANSVGSGLFRLRITSITGTLAYTFYRIA